MNEDELRLMLERLIKKTSVFNHLFTHLRSFVSFNSCAAFKSYKMTWEGAPKQKKPDDATWNKQWDFVFLFHWIRKWLFLLLGQPQMVSVFLGNFIAFFNLLGAQDWWCLRHLEDLYNIRKVGVIEKYNKAPFALDKYHGVINEWKKLVFSSCYFLLKLEVCLSSISSTTAAISVAWRIWERIVMTKTAALLRLHTWLVRVTSRHSSSKCGK